MNVTRLDCIPLNFFNKLPPEIKLEIDDLTLHLFGNDIIERMMKDDYMLKAVYTITPEKAKLITYMYDDYAYWTIYDIYSKIQPIYKELFEGRNFYKRYPEYLI